MSLGATLISNNNEIGTNEKNLESLKIQNKDQLRTQKIDNTIKLKSTDNILCTKNNNIFNTTISNINKQNGQTEIDRTLFTFKPKLNPKSALIAQNFINFYERQNLATRKQLEMVGIF